MSGSKSGAEFQRIIWDFDHHGHVELDNSVSEHFEFSTLTDGANTYMFWCTQSFADTFTELVIVENPGFIVGISELSVV